MSVADQLALLENVVRLRRAGREAPHSRDIVVVRSNLERSLGGTVSRALAARLLGVSHTAFNRWVDQGDIPVVYGLSGRMEVPVPALLDIHEECSGSDADGHAAAHPLQPIMAAARRRAATIDRVPVADRGHRKAEQLGLAYHRVVAGRLTARALDAARHQIWQWRHEGKLDDRYAEEWEQLLSRPASQVAAAIVEDSDRGAELRQSSPFAGVLSEPERRRALGLVED